MDRNAMNWKKERKWNNEKDEQFLFQRQEPNQHQFEQFELFSPFIQPFDRSLDQVNLLAYKVIYSPNISTNHAPSKFSAFIAFSSCPQQQFQFLTIKLSSYRSTR